MHRSQRCGSRVPLALRKIWITACVFVLSFATGADSQTILNLTRSTPEFSTLASILSEIPDLVSKLGCGSLWCRSYTVFAPTDGAFDRLPAELLTKLNSEGYQEHLRAVVLYHMVRGRVRTQEILSVDLFQIQTEQGEFLVGTDNGQGAVLLNGKTNVTITDVDAENGIVHGVDAVLIPSFLETDIVGIVEDMGMFTTLLSLAVDAGLVEDLQAEGLTLFAPTDDAFSRVPREILDSLIADPTGALRDVLLYHVVPEVIPRAQVKASFVTTAQGEDVHLNFISLSQQQSMFSFVSSIQVNSAVEVVQDDIFASNGIIHIIDEVLIPPSLVLAPGSITARVLENPELSTLASLLQVSGLNETLTGDGPFTLLAPTNDAFTDLGQETIDVLLTDLEALSNVLLYHSFDVAIRRESLSNGIVVPLNGDNLLVKAARTGVRFNKFCNVQVFNVKASNGVIHIVDQVLTPPDTVIGTARSSSDFMTLVTAIQAAGLVDTLQGGPFTVFTPTDEAFDKLPAGMLDMLLADPEGALREILLYHVVAGNVLAGELQNGPVATAQGEDIQVQLNMFSESTFLSSVTLNNEVTTAATDVVASNGVIHVIDSVLLPASITLPSTPTAPTDEPSMMPSQGTTMFGPSRAPIATSGAPVTASQSPTLVVRPSEAPSVSPGISASPSAVPIVDFPSVVPSLAISASPTFAEQAQSVDPSVVPSAAPSLLVPGGDSPAAAPSFFASTPPSRTPVSDATSAGPSAIESTSPSQAPLPDEPSAAPSVVSSMAPTLAPITDEPSIAPTVISSASPTQAPITAAPSAVPSAVASFSPTLAPVTQSPSAMPTDVESISPTFAPVTAAPSFAPSVAASEAPSVAPVVSLTAYELLGSDPQFSQMKLAVDAANFTNELKDTLFAPPDSAFESLPTGLFDALLVDASGVLTTILRYHVIPGPQLLSAQLVGTTLVTLQGEEIIATLSETGIVLNGMTNLTTPDISASDAVVHVVDTVLIPPSLMPPT